MKRVKYYALLVAGMLQFSFMAEEEKPFEFRIQPNDAFTYGEVLKYRIHFGIINAATAELKIDNKSVMVKDRPTYHITASGRTNSSFDWMYRVREHFESYMDSQSMAPLKYFKSVRENKYKDVDFVIYDHEKEYLYGKKKNLDIPRYVQDIVSGAYYARTIDFTGAYNGKTYPVNIYLDQEVYKLKFKYLGKETIKSDIGKVRCIKLRPQLVVDRVFKDEDDMTIWITDDKNRIPLRVQTDIWVGSLKIDLNEYSGLKNDFSSKL